MLRFFQTLFRVLVAFRQIFCYNSPKYILEENHGY